MNYQIKRASKSPPMSMASRAAYWIIDETGKRVARAYGYEKAQEKLRSFQSAVLPASRRGEGK